MKLRSAPLDEVHLEALMWLDDLERAWWTRRARTAVNSLYRVHRRLLIAHESPPWEPAEQSLRVRDVAEKASTLRKDQEPAVVQEAYKFATNTEDKQHFTAKQTGALIRSLGMATRKSNGNYRCEIDMFQLRDLLKRYPDTTPEPAPPAKPGRDEQEEK
jgi:hypothetical protein